MLDRRVVYLPLLLLVLCFHLAGGFILDDYFHLARSSRPLGTDALRFAIHTDDFGMVLWPRTTPIHLEFLRPASMLSFWMEYRTWGLNAFGYHLDNLLLHLLNVWLVCVLARRLGLSRGTAILVAVAWGLNLQAVPSVGWISGRTELLCAAFTLSAVLALDQWFLDRRAAWFVAALALATLAPLAKETGVVAPLLMLIPPRIRASHGTAPTSHLGRIRLALLFLPAIAYWWIRFGVLRIPPPHAPYLEPLATIPDVLWLSMKPLLYGFVALFSLPLSHVSPLASLHHHPEFFVLLAAASLLALTRLGRAAGPTSLVWLLAWFVIALLPCLPVLPTSLYLYLPLVGLSLLFGLALEHGPGLRWPGRWLAAWIVIGAIAHGFIAAFTASAANSLARATKIAAQQVDRQRATYLLLLDVPVWAYGLPAAVRLRRPDLRFESWILNFSPSVSPGHPSRLRWQQSWLLEAEAPYGRYFDSPVEKFLLFGASPADTTSHRGEQPFTIRPDPMVATPRRLLISFESDARARWAILQFRGWDAVSVEAPSEATDP